MYIVFVLHKIFFWKKNWKYISLNLLSFSNLITNYKSFWRSEKQSKYEYCNFAVWLLSTLLQWYLQWLVGGADTLFLLRVLFLHFCFVLEISMQLKIFLANEEWVVRIKSGPKNWVYNFFRTGHDNFFVINKDVYFSARQDDILVCAWTSFAQCFLLDWAKRKILINEDRSEEGCLKQCYGHLMDILGEECKGSVELKLVWSGCCIARKPLELHVCIWEKKLSLGILAGASMFRNWNFFCLGLPIFAQFLQTISHMQKRWYSAATCWRTCWRESCCMQFAISVVVTRHWQQRSGWFFGNEKTIPGWSEDFFFNGSQLPRLSDSKKKL